MFPLLYTDDLATLPFCAVTGTKANTHVLYGSHSKGNKRITVQEGANETSSANRPVSAAINHITKSRLDEDATALHRLLSNLQVSVPLCLLLAIYFPVSSSMGYKTAESITISSHLSLFPNGRLHYRYCMQEARRHNGGMRSCVMTSSLGHGL